PIVFVDRPGGNYWKGWLRPAIDMLLARKFINESDLALFKITDNNEEAIREITHFYDNYHSTRTVRDELVIRLQRAPGEAQLQDLNARFSDIVANGGFRVSAPLPLEYDEPGLSHLPRLVFKFNRRDHARLRMLIDFLNDL
ncbi:MAG: cytochrome D ubiquinol oxidase subunit II, partial [Tepidisphaerales bacterium]